MRKATALKPFRDLVEGVDREIGNTFSVDDERAEYLVSLGLVVAENISDEKAKSDEVKAPTVKKALAKTPAKRTATTKKKTTARRSTTTRKTTAKE